MHFGYLIEIMLEKSTEGFGITVRMSREKTVAHEVRHGDTGDLGE